MPGPAPLGIYGGTFDPVHQGHLAAARHALQALGMARVHLVVAADPPHREPPWLNADQRLQLLRLALAGEADLVADDCELQRPGPSYSVHTLEHFRSQHPDRPLVLLLGSDALAGLPSWYQAQRLPELTHLAVLQRPGHPLPDLQQTAPGFTPVPVEQAQEPFRRQAAGLLTVLDNPLHDISATAIRRAVQQGRAPNTLPTAVLQQLRRWGLDGTTRIR